MRPSLEDMKYGFIFLIVINLLSCGQAFNDTNNPLNNPEKIIIELNSSHKTKLYLKQMTWGLTSDKRNIFLSSNKNFENTYHSDSDMVFYDYDSFFYRFRNDTLTIITMKKYEGHYKLPDGFIVIQREIDNVEFQNSWNSGKYKKAGFEIVSNKID